MKQLLIGIAVFCTLNTSLAQEFHVTTSGDDGGTGLVDDPWESIQHAMDYATVGSTVLIHEGIYNERVYVNVNGEEGAYITFKAFEEDEVVLDGAGWTDYALLEIYDVHHIAIEGIKIKNNVQLDAVGILIEGACDHIRIEDCDVSNVSFSLDPNAPLNSETNAQPIIVYGSESDHPIIGLEIIDNEIFDCVLGYSEALAVNGNIDGFIVSENEVHDVTNIGIDIIGHEGACSDPAQDQARNGIISLNETYNCNSPYATSAGIYVDGGRDLIIENNIVHHNQWGIEIGCENPGTSASNILVRNNFIYSNTTAGLAIGGYDYPNTGKIVNTVIVNNTLYGNDTDYDATGELYLSYVENLEIANNIFRLWDEQNTLISDENLPTQSVNISMHHNCWYNSLPLGYAEYVFEGNTYNTLLEFTSATGFGESSIELNPLLADLSNDTDLHLTQESPCINAGTSAGLNVGSIDIDGEIRMFNGNIDIGADEFGSSVSISEPTRNASVSIYPNPSNNRIFVKSSDRIKQISLWNSLGEKMLSSTTTHCIDLLDFKSGLYTLSVLFEDGSKTSQRVIKH